MYCITSIHVQKFLTSIHVASQIQTRSRCTRLTSSHFTYQIPRDQKNCISARSHSHLTISRSQSVCLNSHPSMSTLTSIKVPILASHLHSSNISLTFRSHLNLIRVKIIASQLRFGANIPPFRFWGKLITSTHTASQLHEAPYIYIYIYISPPSKSSLIPDQILISVYHPQPGPHYCILQ